MQVCKLDSFAIVVVFPLIKFFLFLLVCSQVCSCVSISFPDKETEKSKAASFKAPGSTYLQLTTDAADVAWQNSENGSTISFISSCNENSDPSLRVIQKMSTDGIDNMKVLKEEYISYNQRAALRSTIIGKVDGVPIELELIVFKKNNCLYNLTYISTIKKFMEDLSVFRKFQRGFVVK